MEPATPNRRGQVAAKLAGVGKKKISPRGMEDQI
jgi:hypothetical protein